MENKKEIRISLGTLISVIVIITLLVAIIFIIYNNNMKINDLERTISKQKSDYEEKIKTSQENNLKKDSEEKEENIEEKREEIKFIAPSIYTATPKNVDKDARYELIIKDKEYYWAEIKDGKVYMGTSSDMDDTILYQLVQTNQTKINNQQSQEITGFNKKVVDIYFANLSQNDIATHVLFLMEDGTVEYSSMTNIIINATTQGKLEGLNNIVKVQDVSVNYDDGDGYSSVILIDKDNNYYDLNNVLPE